MEYFNEGLPKILGAIIALILFVACVYFVFIRPGRGKRMVDETKKSARDAKAGIDRRIK